MKNPNNISMEILFVTISIKGSNSFLCFQWLLHWSSMMLWTVTHTFSTQVGIVFPIDSLRIDCFITIQHFITDDIFHILNITFLVCDHGFVTGTRFSLVCNHYHCRWIVQIIYNYKFSIFRNCWIISRNGLVAFSL